MTDGSTGYMAPITEDDMSKVHDILRRAADAIVGMSQLKVDVDSLTAKVQQTTDELDRYRRSNEALEEALSNTRQRRTELEARLSQSEGERTTAIELANRAKADLETTQANYAKASDERSQAWRERDDAQLRSMELEDELSKVKSILDKVRDVFGAIPPAVPPSPPTSGPVVQQPAEASPTPVPALDPVPTPVTPTPSRPRIYTDRWMPGSLWDEEKSQYYTETGKPDDDFPF